MWQTVLAVVLGAAAFFGALGVISKAPPVRWLIRRNVAAPISEWHEASTLKVLNEHGPAMVERVLDGRPVTNSWGADALRALLAHNGLSVSDPHAHDTKETP